MHLWVTWDLHPQVYRLIEYTPRFGQVIRHRWSRSAGQVLVEMQVPTADLDHASTYRYHWVCSADSHNQVLSYNIHTSDPSEDTAKTLLFFGCLPLSLKMAMISSHGTAPGRSHHIPSTDATWVLSSEREWHIFDTVRPPWEKAHSTLVDVAVSNIHQYKILYANSR